MGKREALLAQLYEAFNRRDIETVISHLHPDVDWPDQLEHRRLHGRDAVRDYWREQFKVIAPEQAPIRFEELSPTEVLVTVHQRIVNLDGQIWSEGQAQHRYEFSGDLIIRMTPVAL